MFKYNFISKREHDNLRKTTIAINYKSPFIRWQRNIFPSFCEDILEIGAQIILNQTAHNIIYTQTACRFIQQSTQSFSIMLKMVTEHLSSLQTDFDNHWKGYKCALPQPRC